MILNGYIRSWLVFEARLQYRVVSRRWPGMRVDKRSMTLGAVLEDGGNKLGKEEKTLAGEQKQDGDC